ncbi:MAG TPA: hypothetical protein VL985_04635 [Stellaceae bacterium]|nr:hypothetical protein [Stellaceae bacterium]
MDTAWQEARLIHATPCAASQGKQRSDGGICARWLDAREQPRPKFSNGDRGLHRLIHELIERGIGDECLVYGRSDFGRALLTSIREKRLDCPFLVDRIGRIKPRQIDLA